MISLGLLLAVAAGGGVFATQLRDAEAVAGLVCEGAPPEVVVQSAGPPMTELMAIDERPGAPLRVLAR